MLAHPSPSMAGSASPWTTGQRVAPVETPAPGWGWLEWTVLAQTVMPGLMFIPALTPLRLVTRVASFVIALMALGVVLLSGRRAVGRRFPAAPWAAACMGWMALMIFHPTTNSLISGLGSVMLNLAVLSPAFWGPQTVRSTRQLPRVMAILFLCNAIGALMGIGQVYRPDIFNPPIIPVLESGIPGIEGMLSFTTVDGRVVLRPCGLTDTPGSACIAGSTTCLLGICWALQPIARWRRLASVGLALAGAAALYLSQVRLMLVTTMLCLGFLMGILLVRRDYRKATSLAALSALTLVLSLVWVIRTAGMGALDRIMNTLAQPATEAYYESRGHFLEATFGSLIWEAPLGLGLGRWGMINSYFGSGNADPERGTVYVELQWTGWIVDGGIPLMVLYVAAIAAALYGSYRTARTSQDNQVGFWSGTVLVVGLNYLVSTFASVPFVTPGAIQFWALFAAAHAADQRSRMEIARAEALRQQAAAPAARGAWA